ncbi:MAG: hypothetical protein ACE5GA_08725 [Candidatus Zixiibacteriota bacterium]
MEERKDATGNPQQSDSDSATGSRRAALEVDPVKLNRFTQEIRDNQNLALGLVGGLGAASLGATAWGLITALSGYQIGFMAIGVGFLVGITVRKLGDGIDKSFGVAGAFCSLLGCLAGNLLTLCIVLSKAQNTPIMELISRLDWETSLKLMADTFSPIDLLFYGLALYYGYKYSFRQITPEEMGKLLKSA